MIVGGAGGHALEICDILIHNNLDEGLFFFDNINPEVRFCRGYEVLKSFEEIIQNLGAEFKFVLGTGNPIVRRMFHDKFINFGGTPFFIRGQNTVLSDYIKNEGADIMHFVFVGSSVTLGKGALINSGAQIHHEVTIGEFSEINPGAIILGKAKIGEYTSVGTNATILPRVKVGNNVLIGAGSVVLDDIPDNSKVVGVPARIIGENEPIF